MTWSGRITTQGDKGWLREQQSAAQLRTERSVCTAHQSDEKKTLREENIYKTVDVLELFFFSVIKNAWEAGDETNHSALLVADPWLESSVQIPHKTSIKNIFTVYLLIFILSQFFVWIGIFGVEAHTRRFKIHVTYLQSDLWFSLLVWISCFRHYSIRWGAESAELGPEPDKDGSVPPGAPQRRSRKTPVISLDYGNPTGAPFKWTTMISKWLSV